MFLEGRLRWRRRETPCSPMVIQQHRYTLGQNYMSSIGYTRMFLFSSCESVNQSQFPSVHLYPSLSRFSIQHQLEHYLVFHFFRALSSPFPLSILLYRSNCLSFSFSIVSPRSIKWNTTWFSSVQLKTM